MPIRTFLGRSDKFIKSYDAIKVPSESGEKPTIILKKDKKFA